MAFIGLLRRYAALDGGGSDMNFRHLLCTAQLQALPGLAKQPQPPLT
jgi:hypothetical protein